MKLGIKVGLQGTSKADIEETHPDFCEIWFHSGKIPEYDDLFNFLNTHKIPMGLHFWGTLQDGTMCNLGYPDSEILSESSRQIKKTLDTASQNHAVYVNLHPTAFQLTKVDFEREDFTPYGPEKSWEECQPIFQESLSDITAYANSRNVPLCLESVPIKALGTPWHGVEGRLKPKVIGEIPVTLIEPFFSLDYVYFANDFGHTAAMITASDRKSIVEHLFNIARRLAYKTRLLHVNYIIPPYNGTDYHGCLYYPEFSSSGAVPNKSEMIELIKLFLKRDDIFALVEPEKDHPGNYQILKQLVTQSR